MERRILVGAAEPVLDMQQYRFWHITAIGQKITSNGSLPLWVVTYILYSTSLVRAQSQMFVLRDPTHVAVHSHV